MPYRMYLTGKLYQAQMLQLIRAASTALNKTECCCPKGGSPACSCQKEVEKEGGMEMELDAGENQAEPWKVGPATRAAPVVFRMVTVLLLQKGVCIPRPLLPEAAAVLPTQECSTGKVGCSHWLFCLSRFPVKCQAGSGSTVQKATLEKNPNLVGKRAHICTLAKYQK